MNNEMKRVGLVFDSEGNVDFVKTLKEVNSELRENYNQFKLAQVQWNSSTSTTEKLTAKQKYLNEAYQIQNTKVEALTKQLEELKQNEENNQKAIEKKEKALSQAKLQLEKYGAELKQVEDKLKSTTLKTEDFVKSAEKIGNSIEAAGKKISVFSGIAVTAMGVSLKSAIDFESAFTGVEKTVDGTTEQLEDLKNGIRDLAKEIPASTTEISAVAEAAGQLGIQTDNVLEFTKTMINMGNATNLSAEEAATTLARFANVTKMSQTDFDRLGATIVALGNNFATTEAEIAQMAMNLGSAGSQVGMTQSEIVALATALSSVGLEAQAGGTAFSKLMINMQLAVETGSESLQDFAKVAGMSADEFSKAFKEDATSALLAFIDGLSKSGEQGESAIKVLDDMGISETRLRDSILRSTNASELFNDAIKLGNQAWNDNTALTNEANKRYDTLKSKLEVTKNKLLDNAITIGNKLMPTVEKIVDKVDNWTDKLSNMNDEQIETILKIGAFVVAAGPAITILGKLTSGVGSTVKGFSTFVDALKVANGKMSSTKDSVNNLANIFSKLASPIGIATTVIGLGVGALEAYNAKLRKASEEQRKVIEEIQTSANEYNEMRKAQEEAAAADINYIDNVQNLYNELKNITDENGKIKEGYEDRARFIVNELEKALGTEINLTDNIIQNYSNLQQEIQDLILLKKANILLDLKEQQYQDAMKNKDEYYANMIKAQEQLKIAREECLPIIEKYGNSTERLSKIEQGVLDAAKQRLSESEALYSSTKQNYDNSLSAITDYEEGSAIILSKDSDNINDWVNRKQVAMMTNSENEKSTFSENIQQLLYNINYYKQLLDKDIENKNEAGIIANQNQIKNSEESLKILISSMKEQTSTINENSPEIENAWRTLATSNFAIYKSELDHMPPELKSTIEKMTGVSVEEYEKLNTETEKSAYLMSKSMKNGLSDMLNEVISKGANIVSESKKTSDKTASAFNDLPQKTREIMRNAMIPMSEEMNSASYSLYNKATEIANGILYRLKSGFDEHSPSRETRKIFKNLMFGAEIGVEDEEENLYKQTDEVAENVLDSFDNLKNKKANTQSNYSNSSNSLGANNIIVNVDYNQLYLIILKALNSCKLKFDDDGFMRLVDDRLREVI